MPSGVHFSTRVRVRRRNFFKVFERIPAAAVNTCFFALAFDLGLSFGTVLLNGQLEGRLLGERYLIFMPANGQKCLYRSSSIESRISSTRRYSLFIQFTHTKRLILQFIWIDYT